MYKQIPNEELEHERIPALDINSRESIDSVNCFMNSFFGYDYIAPGDKRDRELCIRIARALRSENLNELLKLTLTELRWYCFARWRTSGRRIKDSSTIVRDFELLLKAIRHKVKNKEFG